MSVSPRLPDLPVEIHRRYATRDDAVAAPLGGIELARDTDVPGLWVNRAFEPSRVRYDAAYDNALQHAPTFVAFADELAARLVERFGLRRGLVTEVGAGDGWFLDRLRAAGARAVEGFDPKHSAVEAPRANDDRRLLVARHVIEHVPDPVAWLRELRALLPDGGSMYLEAPAAEAMCEAPGGVGVLDLIYEHRSYFSVASLAACAEQAGFAVTASGRAFYGQYAWIEARPGRSAGVIEHEPPNVPVFIKDAVRCIARLDDDLARLASHGDIALWGAGSKGKVLLNLLPEPDRVRFVYDANPGKWGAFVAGAGHEIRPPTEVGADAPATILVTNPAYRAEVEAATRALMPRPAVRVVGRADDALGASHA